MNLSYFRFSFTIVNYVILCRCVHVSGGAYRGINTTGDGVTAGVIHLTCLLIILWKSRGHGVSPHVSLCLI